MGMTIDKIIKRLLWFEDYNEEDYCGGDRIQDEHGDWFYKVTEEDFEAFRQAADTMRKYQELEQEPTTKNDLGVDCISRADALALYCDKCGVYNCISKCSSYRAVEKMPSVTPQEPKTGHWIDINGIYAKCSNCNEEIYITGDFNYCPNCGADMREVEE